METIIIDSQTPHSLHAVPAGQEERQKPRSGGNNPDAEKLENPKNG